MVGRVICAPHVRERRTRALYIPNPDDHEAVTPVRPAHDDPPSGGG
jgi:hypothetical protein